MLTLLICSLCIFILFPIYYLIKFKEFPESISGLVWNIYNHKYVWTLWIWIVGFSIIIPIIDCIDDNFKIIGFLTVIYLIFVGAMPLENNSSNKLHWIFGILTCIFSQIFILFINPSILLSFILCLIIIKFQKYYVLIIEVICILNLYITLFIEYYD